MTEIVEPMDQEPISVSIDRFYDLTVLILEGREDEAALMDQMLTEVQVIDLARAAVAFAAGLAHEAWGDEAVEHLTRARERRRDEGR